MLPITGAGSGSGSEEGGGVELLCEQQEWFPSGVKVLIERIHPHTHPPKNQLKDLQYHYQSPFGGQFNSLCQSNKIPLGIASASSLYAHLVQLSAIVPAEDIAVQPPC